MKKAKKLLPMILMGLMMCPSLVYADDYSDAMKPNIFLIKGQEEQVDEKEDSFFSKWESSNPKVATVDEEGNVKAKKRGYCTITYHKLWEKESYDITVESPVLKTEKETLNIGEGTQFYMEGTGRQPKWDSSDESIAKVNSYGEIVGEGSGTATITASLSGKHYEKEVVVNTPEIPKEVSVKKGDTKEILIENTPVGEVSWTSDNPQIASVDREGKIKGENVGKTLIHCKKGNWEGQTQVSVTGKQNLSLEGPDYGTPDYPLSFHLGNFIPTYKVVWKGATEKGNGTAEFVPKKEGKHKVSVTVEIGNKKKTFTKEVVIKKVKLSAKHLDVRKGETFSLSLTSSLPGKTTWDYDHETLEKKGDKFTAKKPGETSIIVHNGGVAKECTVTIDDKSIGEAVVAEASKYIGNPYVWGGSSLTNGTDCSGFTMRIFEKFGINLPHSSSAQRSYGSEVPSLSEAKAGDLICYSGHVGIYDGQGGLIHASTEKTGIKHSDRADYRSIVTIRRLVD